MAEHDSFNQLLDLFDAGEHDAAGAEIFVRFTTRLVSLARSRLSDQMRSKVDAEDVVQSAYRSFFKRQAQNPLEPDSWERLWGLLAILTLRKCYSRVDYYQAEKRDLRRETSPSSELSVRMLHAESADPTPAEAAALTEVLEHTMAKLDEHQREILSMTLQGYEVREISDQVGLSERTVHRVRKEIRDDLRGLISAAE